MKLVTTVKLLEMALNEVKSNRVAFSKTYHRHIAAILENHGDIFSSLIKGGKKFVIETQYNMLL